MQGHRCDRCNFALICFDLTSTKFSVTSFVVCFDRNLCISVSLFDAVVTTIFYDYFFSLQFLLFSCRIKWFRFTLVFFFLLHLLQFCIRQLDEKQIKKVEFSQWMNIYVDFFRHFNWMHALYEFHFTMFVLRSYSMNFTHKKNLDLN